jgi:radical SAM protein with 4Fe4S-binding SPASM domain
MKPYLVRRERSCGIVMDRSARRWNFTTSAEADVWAARPDAETIDYRGAVAPGKRVRFGAPHSLFLDVTYKCQCNCWYCYNRAPADHPREMSAEEMASLVRRFAEIGGMELRLAGGEPTLRPGLPGIVKLADELALRTVLVTNGMIAEGLLRKLARTHVSAYYISIQGDRETHDAARGQGSYDWCVRSAKFLAAAGAAVRLSMVFHKRNRHCVEHVAALAAGMGAGAAFNPLRPVGGATPDDVLSPEEHRRLVEEAVALRKTYPRIRIDTPWDYLAAPPGPPRAEAYKRIGCGNGGLTVTASGDCFTCGQVCGRPEFCAGNVRREDLRAVWLRSRDGCPLTNADLPARCTACPYLYGSACFGGCAVTALVMRGAMDAGDPYCFAHLVTGGEKA